MTPQEAADIADEAVCNACRRHGRSGQALDVLVDHARASAEPTAPASGDTATASRAVVERELQQSSAGWPSGVAGEVVSALAAAGLLAPAALPIAVGDTVRSAAELDRLPAGAVIRIGGAHRAVLHKPDGGWRFGEDMQDDRHVQRIVAEFGARVLDLPEVTS